MDDDARARLTRYLSELRRHGTKAYADDIEAMLAENAALRAACRAMRDSMNSLVIEGGGHYEESAARRDRDTLDAALGEQSTQN